MTSCTLFVIGAGSTVSRPARSRCWVKIGARVGIGVLSAIMPTDLHGIETLVHGLAAP